MVITEKRWRIRAVSREIRYATSNSSYETLLPQAPPVCLQAVFRPQGIPHGIPDTTLLRAATVFRSFREAGALHHEYSPADDDRVVRSEEHTSELQSQF